MSETDQTVTPVAELLLGCLEQELDKVPKPPASVSLRVGEQVTLYASRTGDECCAGVGWVRIADVFPSDNFPERNEGYSQCGPLQYAAVFELGAARCAPRPGVNAIPTRDEWNAKAHEVQDDAAAMRRAVCAWRSLDPDRMYTEGSWEPWPTEGGCIGGTLTVTVAVDPCDC